MCVWCGPAGDTARGGAPSGCGERLFRAIGHILPLYTKNGRKCGYLVHQATLYIRTFCLSRQLHGTARPVMVAGGGPGGGPPAGSQR
jgi:hypothetical protein